MRNPRAAKMLALRARVERLQALAAARAATPRRPQHVFLPRPAVAGPVRIKVGRQEYGLPERSRIIRRKSVTFAKTPEGTLHALSARGEAVIPDNLRGEVEALFGAETHASAPSTFASLGPGPSTR